ncbi:hypothetical protein [Paraburkholderia sp. BCC1886]|uniref:hypothetical protein n=1 Tax=Paraburkholderia sp. BCC1886 TaxID=2562670 RepID=UPI001183AF58|nr:hypothetical protein [Paraburkholderia sp. BCC1886]
MSTSFNDRLYTLLPSIYRQRDGEVGEPLRMLLSVISAQVDALEADMGALYDNWFIETCEDWVVPYIGDLIGYRTLHDAGQPDRQAAARAAARTRILIPRRDVGNTLKYRRRKGTLALLDDLASAVSGWPSRAVEYGRLVAGTQALDHLRLARGGTAAVRRADTMGRLGSPSDETAHLVDVRRPQSNHTRGLYNPAAVGVMVWRLRSYAVERTQAYCVEWEGRECYTFSVLGNDCPLFANATNGTSSTSGAKVAALPQAAEADPAEPGAFLRPLPLALRRADIATRHARVKAAYYGPGASFTLWPDRHAKTPVALERLVVADLSGWTATLRTGEIAIDPERGRLMFAPNEAPEGGLMVSYHYGSSADLGGGTYARAATAWTGSRGFYRVGAGGFTKLEEALQAWRKDKPPHAVIEFATSDVYVEPVRIAFEENMQSLEIRAASGVRPVIRQLDYQANRADAITITGESTSRLVLEGLLICGRGLQLKGPFAQLTIRHCTLVPGWEIERLSGQAESESREHFASLALARTGVRVLIDHSILGPIVAAADRPGEEPLPLTIVDSVIDSVHQRYHAIGAEKAAAHVVLRAVRSTVLGGVRVNALELGENSLFNGRVEVARRQSGCVRFCYVPPDSHTPRRFECEPDLAISRAQSAEARADAAVRVRPIFNDVRYGSPTYCQLAGDCAPEILQGADDESEMGVFHDLYQPQRMANLLARLSGFVPAQSDAGVIVVT